MKHRIPRALRRLQFQLFLWAVLPVTLVIIAVAFTGVFAHQREMRDFVTDRNLSAARLMARSIGDGLAFGTLSPDAEGLSEWLLPIAKEQPQSVSLLVIDGRGMILASPKRPGEPELPPGLGIDQALEQREGSVILPTELHGPVLVTFAPVPGTDWEVLVREPVDAIIGPILRLSSLAPAVALGAAAVSVLILTFGWRTIVVPLQNLARAAEQVSWGDLSALTDQPDRRAATGVLEIEELDHALRDMAERIQRYQAGMRDYLTAITEGQEAERTRLARELHDGPVQDLIALGHRAEMGQRLVERNEIDAASALLVELRAAQRETVGELRRIMRALRPAYLEDLGFVPALEALVDQAAARTDAVVELEKEGAIQRLAPDVELAAYRIAQEAVTNAVRHARADRIIVRVRTHREGLVLSVTDDGAGFDLPPGPDVLTRAGHFGLMGMRERAMLLGGSLSIDSAPGEGTRIEVRLPSRPSST